MNVPSKPIVLILCGGQALRLWPLSEYKSKNFLDIFRFSPLELTIKRFLKITIPENIFLAANKSEEAALKKIKLIKKENIFFEPQGRNTAAAILLSLFYLKKRFSLEDSLIISPVDHVIKKEKKFYSALKQALVVSGERWLCILGITPQSFTSDFGYIQADREIGKDVFTVRRFIEKPSIRQAKRLLRKGNCYYNSGMFISTLAVLEEEYQKYYAGYEYFKDSFNNKMPLDKEIAAVYKKIENVPFDKAIMEKTRKARLVKGNFAWKDFGNWGAIYDVLPKDRQGNVKKGKVFINKGKNNFVYLNQNDKKVLVMGVDDVVLVDTPKYALLTRCQPLANFKTVLKEFKKRI